MPKLNSVPLVAEILGDYRKSRMRILTALICFNTLAGVAFIRFAECAVSPASVIQQSQTPTPEARKAFEIVVLIGAMVTHEKWVSFLKSHPVIREFEEKGGTCRHVSDGLFAPDLSFSNDWNIECVVPPFSGNERDVEKVIKTLGISEITVRAEAEHPLIGSFLSALDGDPIHRVDLQNVILDQRSIQILADNCEHLVDLHLNCSSLNDEQLKVFDGCHRLDSVTIHSNVITDASLSAIVEGAKELGFIELHGANVDGSFLSEVEGNLFWLQLDDCKITDEGMKGLRRVAGVEVLSIKHSNDLTDQGIKEVSFLTALTGLDLSGTKISNDGLTTLVTLESLDTLVLNDCKGIDDDCIATFEALKSVSRLSIQNTGLSEAGVSRLRENIPDCKIVVTDAERWVNPFTGSVLDLH